MPMRLYTSQKTRRAPSSHARRLWRRLLLENLEDRVVPSIPDGTILVATSPSSFASTSQSSFPTGIIGVNPSTGAQSVISTGNLFSLPTYTTEAPNQQLYVSDLTAFGTGAIIRIDPNTGLQTLLTKGALINGPNTVAFMNGYLYVADEADGSGSVHNIVRIDPNTGQQTLITDGPHRIDGGTNSSFFSIPVGMVPGPGNNLYLADEPGNFTGTDPGKLWEINLDTGQQTLISSNNSTQGVLFNHPVDVAVDPSGNIIIANTGGPANNIAGSVIRINPQTGVQTLITSFGPYSGTDSVEVGQNGTIFVGAIAGGTNPGQIIVVNPGTGAQNTLASGVDISLVEGIRAFHATVQPAATTTSMTSSASPSVFGQSVIFTATITASTPGGGTPTGTVQFQVDGTNFGSPVSLSSGVATSAAFSTASVAVGTHTVSASYSGDSSFATSSATLSGGQIVNKASSSTAVASSANSSVFGQSVTFTATVTASAPGGGTPTGTVQFQIDGTNFGSPVNLSGGMATSTATSSLSVNGHTIKAVYSGDTNFTTGTGTLTQAVNQASTTATLSSSANPSISGQSVTFTATISVTAPGAGTPTGTIQFKIDGANASSPVSLSSGGTATFSTASLAVGTHTVTATYSGDSSFATSNSTLAGGQVVNKPAPAATTTVVSASANPSVFGQSVTFTATISVPSPGSGTPTGTVQFQIDNSNVGSPVSVSTSGGLTTATFSTVSLAVGTHTVTATYSGDGSFATSNGSLSGGQTVGKSSTSTAVTSSVSPSVFGQSVTFTATLNVTAPGAGTPTGTVQFQIDNNNAGSPVSVSTSGSVTTASFSTASLAVGTHTVTAIYSADSSFAGSMGTLSSGQTVNKASASIAVASSVNPSLSGQSVTFTATISVTAPGAGTPTGTVQFQIDSSNVGSPVTVSTSGGVTTASFSSASLAVGTHTVTASYSGDGSFATSSGSLAGGQVINNKPATTTALSSSANPSVSGQSVTFTATISVTAPGTPTGTVQFQVDSSNIGSPISVSTSGSVTSATFSTASLAVGTHTVTASYSGDSSFASSTGSLSGGQTVGAASTSTAVSSSVNPLAFGQSVTFTATISATAPGAGTPTGTVQFQIDNNNAGSPVSVSTTGHLTTATFSTASLAVGTHTVTATYSGDSSFASSTGSLSGAQTVTKASTSTAVSSSINPSMSGQSVTFTATISVTAPGAGMPTGTVQFQIDSSNVGSPVGVSTSGGVTTASFSTASLAVGTHTITATYSGDSSFATSNSTLAGGQVVNKPAPAPTTTVLSASADPSMFGQSVTFTATVSVPSPGSGSPTGTVQFQIDSSNVGSPVSISTSGGMTTAAFSTVGLAVGTHTVTATYSGDSSFAGSTGSLSGGQTVGKASTSTAVTSSVNPSVSGQPMSFTATINVTAPGAGTPTGTVQFQIDNNNAGSPVSVSTFGGVTTAFFSTASLAVGTHTVTATYSGDSSFAGSAGSLSGGQTVAKASTSMAVTSSANPSVSGQSVNFTAAINVTAPGAGTPTGSVQFQIDSSNVGSPVSVSTSGGVTTASFSTASLAVGTHTVTASYSGDGSFATSSGSLTGGQVVNNKPATTTALSSSANPSVSGQSVTFTAIVSIQNPGTGTPTGTVQFQSDSSNVGSPVNVSTSGSVTSATFSTASLAVGTHTVTASYSGDGSFASSTGSLSGGQTVGKASTSTAVSSSVNPLVFGQSVTFTATISLTAPGAGTPTGTVQFQIDNNNAGSPVSVNTSGGVTTATFSTASLAVGTHTVTASYSGDSSFASSTGSQSGQTVGKANTSTAVSSSANPSSSGQGVIFTAVISVTAPGAGTPTGTVQFQIDSSNIGSPVTVSTSGGVTTATLSTATLAVGTHTVTATYSGDSSFATSNSTLAGGQVVNKPVPTTTTTVVSASANPSVFGQSVTFTATISVPSPGSGTPTGTAQFQIDGSNVGSPVSVSTSGGLTTATFSTVSLAVGTHTVTATYSGDGNFAASNGSLSGGQTVGKASTSTVVTSSVSPSVFGQSLTFTATINVAAPGAGTPTGTVQFQIDNNNAGSPVSVSTFGGITTASFSTASLAVGTHTVTAIYSGDNSFANSMGSLSGGQSVGKGSTSTAVTSSTNPSVFGQSVTFTATVTASAPGSGAPSGTVQFQIDGSNFGSPVSLSGGMATSTATSGLSVSGHTVKAVYSGDMNFTTSTGTLTQTVNPASTTATLSSSANPSISGQSVTFTATINVMAPGAGTPTGTIQFQIDGASAGSPVSLSSGGTATFSSASLAVGTHTVSATYSGDSNFTTSSGTLSGGQAVTNKPGSNTVVSSSINPSVFGQSVSFTATVTASAPGSGTPTGTVQFQIDGTNFGNPVNLSSGVATSTATSNLSVSGHTIKAVYSGDTNFATSTGILTQTVNQASTSSALTSSANPSVFGQSVTFTATVTASAPGSGTPTGTVQFQIDGTNFGNPVNLSSGVATSTATSSLSVSGHTIKAVYSGDTNFTTSTGTLTQTDNQANTTVTLSSSANPSTSGQSVTFTATISVTAPGAGTPTGTVQFQIDGASAGSPVSLSSGGTATFSTASLVVGTHIVSASYSGDNNFTASSGTLSGGQAVTNKPGSNTVVTSSANPSAPGQSVTFTATVTPSGSGAAPTGTVQWQIDGTNTGGPVAVSTTGGVTTATLTTSTLSGGTHTITASYSGDSNYQPSSGSLQQTVNTTTASSTTTVTSSANPQTLGQPVSWTATVTGTTGLVNFVNFETGDFSQSAAHTNGAIVTSPALDGTYSLQLQRSNSVANYEIRQSGTTYYNLPTAYYRFLFEYTSNPAEGGICNFQDTASGFKAALHLSAANKLLFYDSSGTLLATGTTVLAPGQIYTIDAKIGTGTNATWEIRINGNVEMSGAGNLGANNNGSIKLGGNGAYTTTYYYDDVAINSLTYPGKVPTGTVQFAIDGVNFGAAVPLSGGSAISRTTSTLSAGNHVITASYSGDSTFAPSSGTLSGGQTINPSGTALADGTILVVSSPLSGQPSAPTGIIGINPSTGAQSVVSAGGLFSLPETIREASNQQLYVVDYSASQTGAIIRVDPNTGQQSVVATGGNINGPDALAIINGFIYVADTGGATGTVPNLVEINLSTGQQRLVSSGGNFSTPTGLAPAPNNSVYWADESAFGGAGAIIVVNLQTGAQSVLTQGGLLDHMVDIGLDASGNIIVINAGSSGSGSVIRVNPQTHAQTLVSSAGSLLGLDGGTVDVNHGGTIFTSALPSGTLLSRILASDPVTGAQRTISSGGSLSLVAGLVVFNKAGTATTTTVSSSANPSVSGQSVTFTATVSVTPPGTGTPTGTVQFQIDGTNFGSPVSLSSGGTATISTASLTVGTHTVTALYSGGSNFAASSGMLSGGQVVNQAATTLADGTILVVSSPLSGQPSAPTGIIGINPSTGAQFVVSAGGLFSLPETIREASNQQLYVVDYSASQTGAIIRVDPNTGQQSMVATGGNINGPDALAIINGFIYVADTGGATGTVPNLVEINLSTGQQRLVSSGGNFSTPTGLAPAPNNSVYWADESAFGGAGAIIVVNLQTGAQSVLTQGGLLDHMVDIGLDASGNIIVINAGSSGSGSVVRVNAQTHAQTLVSSGGSLLGLDGGTVDVNHGGTIFTSALASGTLLSRILASDPVTGAQRTISSGGSLSLVAGLVVFNKAGAGAAAALPANPSMSPEAANLRANASDLITTTYTSGTANLNRSPASPTAFQVAQNTNSGANENEGGGGATQSEPPTAALLVSHAQAHNADPAPAGTTISSVLVAALLPAPPTQLPSQPQPPPATRENAGSTLRPARTDQAAVSLTAIDFFFTCWDGDLARH